MNARLVATRIVRLRRLLIAGMIAELKDDAARYDQLMADFDELAQGLPLVVLVRGGLERRVVEPAARKIEREGILAQNREEPLT